MAGVYGTLLVLLTVFDLGLGNLVNREFAALDGARYTGRARRIPEPLS